MPSSGLGLPTLPGLQGQLPSLPGLGPTERDPLAGLEPDELQVQRQIQEQRESEEDIPFFFKLLELPDRLIGQSIKGLLAGTGEEGIGDNLSEAFLKNPVFQLIDGLFGTDLTGKDVSFRDVRKNNPVIKDISRGLGVRPGESNFALDLIGEILTDPTSFLLPFGLTKAGAKAPLAARKLTNFDAVEKGMKSLFVFKVPFVEARWVVPKTQSLSLNVSRGLEMVADGLNNWGPTRAIAQGFSKVAGIPTAVGRKFVKTGTEEAERAARAHFMEMEKHLYNLTVRNEENKALLRNPDTANLVGRLSELGVSATDSRVGVINTIRNRAVDKIGEVRRVKLFSQNEEAKKLYDEAISGNVDAAREFRRKHPSVQIEEPIREMADIPAIQGVDTPLERVSPTPVSESVFDAVEAGGAQRTEGLLGRLEDAQEKQFRTEEIIGQVTEETVDLFEEVRKSQGADKVRAIQKLAEDGRKLMEELGDKEIAEGLINSTLEFYFPRVIPKQVWDVVNKQFATAVTRKFPAGGKLVADFMKNRKFTQLTTAEASVLAYELGTRFTSDIPVKELLAQPGPIGVHGVLAKIFGDDFAKKLKKMGPGGREAAEFFETNPALAWYSRIRASARAHQKVGTARKIFEEGSPLIVTKARLGSPESFELANDRTLSGFIFTDEPGKFSLKEAAPGTTMRHAVLKDNQAQFRFARHHLQDEIRASREIEKAHVGGLSDDDLFSQVESARALGPKSSTNRLVSEDTDILTVRSLKKHSRRHQEITKKLSEGVDKETATRLRGELKWLNDKIGALRGALNVEFSNIEELRQKILGGVSREARREKLELIEKTARSKMGAPGVTDALAIYRAQNESGALAISELRAMAASADPQIKKIGERLLKNLEGSTIHYMHTDVAREVFRSLDRMNRPDKMGRILGAFDTATWWWKAWTVLPNFAVQTRARDYMTNLILQMQGGASPDGLLLSTPEVFRFNMAYRKLLKTGDAKALEKYVHKDSGMNGLELIGFGQREGLIGSGFHRDEFYSLMNEVRKVPGKTPKDDSLMKRLVDPRVDKSFWLQKGFRLAEFGDDQAKLQGFFAHMRQGKSADEAAALARQWAYDPAKGMTSFERHALRRLIPFYSWMRFAVKTEIDAFFTKPGTVTFWEKLWSAANDAQGIKPEDWQTIVPDWITEAFGIPWRGDSEGNPQFFVLGNYVPLGEVAELANGFRNLFDPEHEDTLIQLFGERMNPFLRNIAEIVRNESFFSQREIAAFPGDTGAMFGLAMPKHIKSLVYNLRWLGELDRLNVFNFGDVDRIISLGKAVPRGPEVGGPEQLSFGQRLLTGAFGPAPKLRKVDVERQLKIREVEGRLEEGKIKSLLKRRVKFPDKVGNEDDIEALRQLWLRNRARRELRSKTAGRFGVEDPTKR